MAIYRLLREASFGPEEIERMTTAYEAVLKLLQLSDRTDPITELIAQKIIEETRKGERDPARISTCVMENLERAKYSSPSCPPPDLDKAS